MTQTLMIFPRIACGIILLATMFVPGCSNKGTDSGTPRELREIVERVVKDYDIPALAAAKISLDNIESCAIGLRKLGEADSVEIDDFWHHGSNTKAMTASMIATLVEEGLLSWNSTPAEVFPELADSIHPGFMNITLHQLLRHRAGVQPFTEADEILELPEFVGTPREQRRSFAAFLLNHGPTGDVGEYEYSNAGYSLAAAMAEKATDSPWEELMVSRIFEPLGIEVIYGWPAASDSNQPWGHWTEGGELVPHDPNDEYQLPAFLDPAGDISLSIGDFALFTQWHLRGLKDFATILEAQTFDALHTPVGDYAMGWAIADYKGIASSMHDGSAGTFYSLVMIQPSENRAFVLVMNAAEDEHIQGIAKALDWLTRE